MDMQESQLVGFRHLPARHPHTRRYPILSLAPRLASSGPQGLVIAGLHIHDGPPKTPWRGWAALAAPGLILHFKISLKNRSALVRMRFWFPPAVVQGLRRMMRWAFLFLASRFASSFWCHLTAVASIKRAVFHHATPKQPELCLHSLPPTLRT